MAILARMSAIRSRGVDKHWTGLACWLVLATCCLSARLAQGADELQLGIPPMPDLPSLSLWQTVVTWEASAGYKDNVALSGVRPSGSPLVRNLAELLVWRLPGEGWEFQTFLTGEDVRYLSSTVVDKEQTTLGVVQVNRVWSDEWTTGLTGQYLYQNRVLDLTTSLATPTVLLVQGHTYTGRGSVRRKFGQGWTWGVEPAITRQDFGGPLDDYWETGFKFSLGRESGRKSETSLNYELTHRNHDRREQATVTGVAIPGSELHLLQHRVQLQWKCSWDELRHWRTSAKLAHELSQDNGSGYFDSRRWQAGVEGRFANAVWDLRLTSRIAHTVFPHQPAIFGQPQPAERTDFGINLRAERVLTKSLRWFAEWDFERSLANRPATGYGVNLTQSGLILEF